MVQRQRALRLTLFVKAAELVQRTATGPLLEQHRLTYVQLSMLLSVARIPASSSAQLARMHGVTAPSAGEVIAALVRRGLMERRADPRHGRIRFILLTKAGEDFVASVQPALDHIDAMLTDGITHQDIKTTRKVLATIAANGGGVSLAP